MLKNKTKKDRDTEDGRPVFREYVCVLWQCIYSTPPLYPTDDSDECYLLVQLKDLEIFFSRFDGRGDPGGTYIRDSTVRHRNVARRPRFPTLRIYIIYRVHVLCIMCTRV